MQSTTGLLERDRFPVAVVGLDDLLSGVLLSASLADNEEADALFELPQPTQSKHEGAQLTGAALWSVAAKLCCFLLVNTMNYFIQIPLYNSFYNYLFFYFLCYINLSLFSQSLSFSRACSRQPPIVKKRIRYISVLIHFILLSLTF
jgi:hypothetical protein